MARRLIVAEMAAPAGNLWRDRNFFQFWIGQTISFFGSEVTALALPLTAVLVLNAGPAEMGLMAMARNLPHLLVGLLAGVWVDRMYRRPILIASDLGMCLLLGSIPLAAVMGWLTMEQLYFVAFGTGIIVVIATVAYQAYLPSLVPRASLVEGNSKMEMSSSTAGIAGPGMGGVLVQMLTAPIAILVDALSFAISAVILLFLKVPESPPVPRHERRSVRADIGEGLKVVLANPLLRALVLCGGTHNFFSRMIEPLYVLYLTQELNIEPVLLGIIVSLGGPGALIGAVLVSRVTRRFGLGPTIVGSQVLTGFARFCLPLASGPFALVLLFLISAEFFLGLARPIFNINQLSLRQGITPDRLQGRVNATIRFIIWGVTPAGALLGGMLAVAIGTRPTLFVAATGVLLASLWAYSSPLRALREQPQQAEDAA